MIWREGEVAALESEPPTTSLACGSQIYPLFLGDVQSVPLLEERDTGLFNQYLQRVPVQRLEAFKLLLALKAACQHEE